MAEQSQQVDQPFSFPEDPPKQLMCSEHTCSAGHVWQPVVAITKCPGCQAPILVLKMVNCPICNEPTSKLRLRCDHLPKGGVVTPVCKGSSSLAEVLTIEIVHEHASQEEARYVDREVISKA